MKLFKNILFALVCIATGLLLASAARADAWHGAFTAAVVCYRHAPDQFIRVTTLYATDLTALAKSNAKSTANSVALEYLQNAQRLGYDKKMVKFQIKYNKTAAEMHQLCVEAVDEALIPTGWK